MTLCDAILFQKREFERFTLSRNEGPRPSTAIPGFSVSPPHQGDPPGPPRGIGGSRFCSRRFQDDTERYFRKYAIIFE